MSAERHAPAFADVSVGQQLPSRTIHIDRARLVQYAGASLDRNPIHWDERFAKKVGLPDVISHGMFTMGAAVELVSDWAGGADRIVAYGTRFTAPVVVPYETGADVDVAGVVSAVDPEAHSAVIDLSVTCAGASVLGKAQVTVVLP
jgi:acyl dehydratase